MFIIYIQPSTHTRLLNLVMFFFYMSKAFDKICHEGLIFKLKSMGISDALLKLIKSFLTNRFQRVVFNGQTSEWLPVKAGVPQGSILGPLFFLIYINDLSVDITSTVKLFADDTSLFSIVHDPNTSTNELNKDLKRYLNGHISGKCHLTQTRTSRLRKLYFPGK